MSKINFLSKDGYINVEEFVALARDIDKMAAKEQLKPAELYFAGKMLPKYDAVKAKAGGELFVKKRAQVIKTKSRMPATGSRMKMQVVLRNYKGLEEFEDYYSDFQAAVKAIAVHNKLAEKTVAAIKKEATKKRDVLNKAFDKALAAFENVLADAGIPEDDVVIGTSMMGKTMIVKLPGGHFVSIGKADAERFNKAKEPAERSSATKAPAVRASRTAKAATAQRARSR